jgi:hypothetical protein
VQQLGAFASLRLERADPWYRAGSSIGITVGNTTPPGQIDLPFSEL